VDDEDKGVTKCDTLGGMQDLTVINESGFYSLVIGSKLPTAKRFKRWVTSEVLPSIRKTGSYVANPDSYMINDPVERAKKWIEEEKVRQEQAKQIEAQKPMVLFANSVSASKSEILVGELAKIIKQNGVDMGEKRLFAWLREHGYLISRKGNDWNMPTQYSMERGLFRIKETTVNHSDGHTTVNKTPKVTGKGQIYFVNKFLGKQKAKALPQ
jgi:anti-repressor protein